MIKTVFSLLLLIPFLGSAQLNQPVIDYRQHLTGVKNQGMRGTCTAFAVASALETLSSSYEDVSEKYIYASLKAEDFSTYPIYEGGFLADYQYTLPKYGLLPESTLPYNPIKARNYTSDENELVKVMLEADLGPVSLYANYLPQVERTVPDNSVRTYSLSEIRDPEFVISLLEKGFKSIPVSYDIYTANWSATTGLKDDAIDVRDCGFLLLENGGNVYNLADVMPQHNPTILPDLFTTGEQYRLLPIDFVDSHYGGHAVNIVGVDGDKFIIRNSWGSDWGDNGYAYLSFNYHRLFVTDLITIGIVMPK